MNKDQRLGSTNAVLSNECASSPLVDVRILTPVTSGGPVHDQPRRCRSATLDDHASMPRALKAFFGKIKSWWSFFTVIELESIPVIVFAWRLLSVSVLSHHSLKLNVLFATPYLTVLFGWARGILTHVPNPANYPFLPLIFYFPHTLICLREEKVGPTFLSLLEDGPAICLVFQPGAPASSHTPPPFTAVSHANQFLWLLLSSSHACRTHSVPPSRGLLWHCACLPQPHASIHLLHCHQSQSPVFILNHPYLLSPVGFCLFKLAF